MGYEQVKKTIQEISAEAKAILDTVSEQKRIAQELQNSYMELSQIFNSALEGMRVIDNNYQVLRINDKMVDISQISRKEAQAKKCFEGFACEVCQTADCPLVRIQNGEERVTFEFSHEGPDGTEMICLVTATPFKGINGELIGIVEICQDITEQKKDAEKINYMAFHDSLTGLPNRICFTDRLTLELAHAKRNQQMLAVLFVDLDGFKSVNDTLGHEMGDQLLKAVAERLTANARASDTISRIGGDEFTILLTGLNSPQNAETFAQTLVTVFEQPWTIGGRDYRLTASIGIALYPGDGEDPDTLMRHADIAMYRAKNEVSIYQFYNYFMNRH